ncbi:methyl-accepting chemotaxis protein [Aestuariirhabdus sp. Z084]|uniref:methyl-accepting chemotaxis protein n=1 Tax=Aestuariirhabdus haliotis TaxID=2918751 RepID=UPI00201B3856|nr:methyl-accepting chemotaxis protein [Aestuariirhabdus haliotis]MCL6416952.1 methyl-accepting chemotaxis protein [Aestuariirhabdus haliotis]MCL6420945.1 methyl-accepting chemotaxis protein [Aestuariirhabdus haliotis]
MLKKFLLPIGGLLLITSILIALLIPMLTEKSMIKATVNDAKQTVNQFKVLRGYYTKNVISKASAFGMSPTVEHKDKRESIPLPATMIHELSELMASTGTEISLYSPFPFPNRKSRQLDNFQSRAWQSLSKDPESVFIEEVNRNGSPFLRIAVADTMQADACVVCHNNHPDTPKNDWKLGDVRGVLEVVKPLADIQALSTETRNVISLSTLLMMALIAAAMAYLFRRVVLNRVHSLESAISELASGEGDLTTELDTGANDELGRVAANFNRFLGTFKNIIEGVIERTHSVEKSTTHAHNSTQNIADKMNTLEGKTHFIASAITEMSSSIKEIAHNTELASADTKQSNERLHESSKSMNTSVETIQQLNGRMSDTATVISSLRDQSDQIGTVLDVIKSISEQTNLLALNAAIEAARAGEQGRGFAVVADEVRGLAHRTQESISEIQETVTLLQSKSEEAEASVKEGCDSSLEASDGIREVYNQLEEAIKLEANVMNAVDSTAAAMEEQHSVSEEMDQSVVDLRDQTIESLELINSITAEFDQIRSEMQQLNSELSRFKL